MTDEEIASIKRRLVFGGADDFLN